MIDRKVGKEKRKDKFAYEWDLITKLAEEDKDKDKKKGEDIRPLDNAGRILT